MTEADKLYEQALALREKATPGKWHQRNGVSLLGPRGEYIAAMADRVASGEMEGNLNVIVAAVNLLDALPALRVEWEREARLAEAEWWASKWNQGCGFCDEKVRCSECDEPRKRIAALQQPAAQEKERRT